MALLLLVGGGAYSLAHAAVILALPADGSNPLAAEELMVTREGIRLHVQARRLGEVLQGIQAQSGIRIEVRSELMRKPITARIEAPDWRLTLEKLLVGFNWMEISDDQRKIRQVIVGGGAETWRCPRSPGRTCVGSKSHQSRNRLLEDRKAHLTSRVLQRLADLGGVVCPPRVPVQEGYPLGRLANSLSFRVRPAVLSGLNRAPSTQARQATALHTGWELLAIRHRRTA